MVGPLRPIPLPIPLGSSLYHMGSRAIRRWSTPHRACRKAARLTVFERKRACPRASGSSVACDCSSFAPSCQRGSPKPLPLVVCASCLRNVNQLGAKCERCEGATAPKSSCGDLRALLLLSHAALFREDNARQLAWLRILCREGHSFQLAQNLTAVVRIFRCPE